ncbi:hypothetical protein MJ575_28660 [Klebsiella pneumoniae]|nr:hypothetical protein MJ575_28660 [Klebsiella pneumoniae]
MVAAARAPNRIKRFNGIIQQTTIVSPVNAKVFDVFIVPGSALLLVNQ